MKKLFLTHRIRNTVSQLSLTLSALVILWCPSTTIAQADFSSVDAFLKATLKGEDKLSLEAKGDLNNDGLEDWAGVIHRERPNFASTDQLYVLVQQGQSGYRIAEKSKEVAIGGIGCCWVEDLKIDRSSIYIQTNAKTAATMEAATHQFKLYKGEWRLIGLGVYYTDMSADTSTDTDINLLTGSVIEKKQKGQNKPIIKKRRKQISSYLLKDFNFSNGFGIE